MASRRPWHHKRDRIVLYSVAGFLNDRIATADAEGMPNSLLPSYDIAIVYRVQHMGSEGLEPPRQPYGRGGIRTPEMPLCKSGALGHYATRPFLYLPK